MRRATDDERVEVEEMLKPILDGTLRGMVVVFTETGYLTHSNDIPGDAARFMADAWRDSIYRETEPIPPV